MSVICGDSSLGRRTLDNEDSWSLRNDNSSFSSDTSFSAAFKARSFSANWSLSSFSLFRNSSLSSLSSPTTVGVCGRLSRSPRNPSRSGLTGVTAPLLTEGVDGVGDGDVGGAFFGAVPAAALSDVAHSDDGTFPPFLQTASSASRAVMYFWYDVFAAWAFTNRPFNSIGESSTLTRAVFLILFARIPNRRVESVSASLYEDGEQLMISVVLELPPRDSCNIRVSFESR